jgi:hypothetical protein
MAHLPSLLLFTSASAVLTAGVVIWLCCAVRPARHELHDANLRSARTSLRVGRFS